VWHVICGSRARSAEVDCSFSLESLCPAPVACISWSSEQSSASGVRKQQQQAKQGESRHRSQDSSLLVKCRLISSVSKVYVQLASSSCDNESI
jgi:hypothetical protein